MLKSIPEISRVLLIPEFDLLIQFNDMNLKNRERQTREVHTTIREIHHVVSARIIPIELTAESSSEMSKDIFAIIRVQPGCKGDILTHLLRFPDIRGAYQLLDENSLFIHAKSVGLNEITAIISYKMAKIKWVSDVDTIIEHLEFDAFQPLQVSPLIT